MEGRESIAFAQSILKETVHVIFFAQANGELLLQIVHDFLVLNTWRQSKKSIKWETIDTVTMHVAICHSPSLSLARLPAPLRSAPLRSASLGRTFVGSPTHSLARSLVRGKEATYERASCVDLVIFIPP